MLIRSVFIISLYSLLALSQPILQNQKPIQIDQHNIIYHSDQHQNNFSYVISNDFDFSIHSFDESKQMNVIVKFKGEPFMIRRYVNNESVTRDEYKTEYQIFSEELNNIAERITKRSQTTNVAFRTLKHFYKLFNGAEVEASLSVIKEIASLTNVDKIYLNENVTAHLDSSVGIIGADSLWKKFDTRGEGVLIGILDTGIDYMHPLLGGGIGDDYKVIGGYDFINDDDDPMDDNFHGTHVAGIVAAESDSINGVAPGASLLALKVLDEKGGAPSTTIIEGIEYVADPDSNGIFDDRPDIVNVSLGGPGNPDSPISIAVNNAVKLGITFCVSAGNNRNFYQISSPGNAELALTVGAVDHEDKIASFSSRGPVKNNFAIKPDVVAPGVQINSTIPEERFDKLNGTSMAAPHVAGLAALLKAIHPDWNTYQIKSAIVNNALDIDEEVMIQGGGRIDAVNSEAARVFLFPSSLSFGLDDIRLDIWQVVDTIVVSNTSDVEQSYDISFTNTQAGIDLKAEPENLILQPNSSRELIVTLQVNNNSVPFPQVGSLAYSGFMQLVSASDTLKSPWAFVKATQCVITTDLPFPSIYLFNNKFATHSFDQNLSDDLYTVKFTVPAGIYDLFYQIYSATNSRVIIKENIEVSDYTELSISDEDAKNKLLFKSVDENNRELAQRPNLLRTVDVLFPAGTKSYFGVGVSDDIASQDLLISDFSDRFKMVITEYQNNLDSENKVRILRHNPIHGISSDLILTNSPSDYFGQKIKVHLPLGKTEGNLFLPYIARLGRINGNYITYASFNSIKQRIQNDEYEFELFMTHEDTSLFFGTTTHLIVSEEESHVGFNDWYFSQPFHIIDGKFGSFSSISDDMYLMPTDAVMNFGEGPIFTNGYHINKWYSKNSISLNLPTNYGFRFFGAMGETRNSESMAATFDIFNADGEKVFSNLLTEFEPFETVAGTYSVHVENDTYLINNTNGNAQFRSFFDLNNEDANPPRINSFRILNEDSLITDRINKGESAELYFSLYDVQPVRKIGFGFTNEYREIPADSTKLFYKYRDDIQWKEIDFTEIIGDGKTLVRYKSEFQTDKDSTTVDLKIVAEDAVENSFEYIISPALIIGDFVTDIHEQNSPLSIPASFALENNYPNPFNPTTNIRYSIAKEAKVELNIYNILGQKVRTLVNDNAMPGNYEVIWDGTNDFGHSVVSGLYIYSLKAAEFHKTKKMILLR